MKTVNKSARICLASALTLTLWLSCIGAQAVSYSNLDYYFYMPGNNKTCIAIKKNLKGHDFTKVESDPSSLESRSIHVVMYYTDTSSRQKVTDIRVGCDATTPALSYAGHWMPTDVKSLTKYEVYLIDDNGDHAVAYSKSFSYGSCPSGYVLYENVIGRIETDGISWIHAKNNNVDLKGMSGKDPNFCRKK